MKLQNKKIEELIEFFEVEKQNNTHYFSLYKDDLKFNFTTSLYIVGIFIAVSSTLLNLNIAFAVYIISGILILILFIMFWYTRASWKKEKEYIKEDIVYNVIINFLQSLKITEVAIDLTPLINKVEQLHRDERILTMKDYDEVWINEIIHSLDVINNQIMKTNKSK